MRKIKEIVIEREKLINEITKASSDCYLKDSDKQTFALTLDRLIEVAFNCLIETEGFWSHSNPFWILKKKAINHGFKNPPLYKSEKELYQMICNFKRENAISGAERAVLNALSKLSSEYRWDLYLAFYEYIDDWLFNIDS